MISYWLRLLNKDNHTLAYIIYIIALNLFLRDEYKTHWLSRVKCILDHCGLSYMWTDQQALDTKQCKLIIHKRIEDVALHKWFTDISTSSMCSFYRLYKKRLDFEKYLLNPNYRERIALCKLRCANIKLPVYSRIFMYSTDICSLCSLNVPGDEYHYILTCPFFKQGRDIFIKPYFYTRPSIFKFEKLLGSSSRKTMSNLAKFANLILKQF